MILMSKKCECFPTFTAPTVPHPCSYPKLLRGNGRGGEWSFKKSGSRKILAEFQGSRSLVFSADLRSRSLDFFRNAVSESRVILSRATRR